MSLSRHETSAKSKIVMVSIDNGDMQRRPDSLLTLLQMTMSGTGRNVKRWTRISACISERL